MLRTPYSATELLLDILHPKIMDTEKYTTTRISCFLRYTYMIEYGCKTLDWRNLSVNFLALQFISSAARPMTYGGPYLAPHPREGNSESSAILELESRVTRKIE